MPLVFFEPRFHLVHFFLTYHALIVEYTCVLLQVFKGGELARALALRRHVIEVIYFARHVVKGTLSLMRFPFLFARSLRGAVRRVFQIEDDRLIADKLLL